MDDLPGVPVSCHFELAPTSLLIERLVIYVVSAATVVLVIALPPWRSAVVCSYT